jgi:hypothetical protein
MGTAAASCRQQKRQAATGQGAIEPIHRHISSFLVDDVNDVPI